MLLASSVIPGFRRNRRICRGLHWSVGGLCRLAAVLSKQIDPRCYQNKDRSGNRNTAPAGGPELCLSARSSLRGGGKADADRLQRFRLCQTVRTTQEMYLKIVLQGRVKPAVQVLFHQFVIGYTLAIHG